MKPDLDGRTVLGLQPRHKALSETFRDNSSDFDILGPDPLRGAELLVHRQCAQRCAHSSPVHSEVAFGGANATTEPQLASDELAELAASCARGLGGIPDSPQA